MDDAKAISQFLLRSQTGYGSYSVPRFHGTLYQEGHGLGSVFSSLGRFALPLLKMVAPHLTSGLAEFTQQTIRKKKPIKKALKRTARSVGVNVLKDAVKRLSQSGKGGKRRKRKRLQHKKRKNKKLLSVRKKSPKRKVASRSRRSRKKVKIVNTNDIFG